MAEVTSVAEYLAQLPLDRREVIEAIREVILANIDPAFEEGIQYRMIGYYLPHSKYPAGYHCNPDEPLPFASIASQKNHIGLYLFCIYGNDEEQETFIREWRATGKRLDMGKACVRVKRLDDIPLEVVGRAFRRMTAKRFVDFYEAARDEDSAARAQRHKAKKKKSPAKKVGKKSAKKKPLSRKATAKKATKKKPATRKATTKKVAKKAAKKAATRKATTKKVAKKAAEKAAKKKPATRKAAAKKSARRKR